MMLISVASDDDGDDEEQNGGWLKDLTRCQHLVTNKDILLVFPFRQRSAKCFWR